MTPREQIDGFAKGWIAQGVRYEPVEKLGGRLKVSVVITLLFLALLATSIAMGFGAWTKFKVIRLDVMLGFLTLVMGFSAFQMSRFIKLRKSLGQVD